MVHCRSVMGAWRHAHRSYLRGFLSRPPVFSGVEMPPPPPPPVFYGVELPEPRVHLHWDDFLLEEEDDWHIGKDVGVVAFLVDAPLTAKDVSLPNFLCLSVLLVPDLLDAVAVSPLVACDTETRTVEKDVLLSSLPTGCNPIVQNPTVGCGNPIVQNPTFGETFSLSSCVYEERNAALLSELRDVKTLVASLWADAADMRSDADAVFQKMRSGLEVDVVNLTEACLSAAVAKSAEFFATEIQDCHRGPPLKDLFAPPCAPPCVDSLEGFSIDEVFLGLQSLRVYCFPLPKSFVWNTNAKKFLVPLPENPEESTEDRAMFALPGIEFYSVLLEHVEANKEENRCVIFDDSGECSRANLSTAHNRLNSCKYTNVRESEDTKPLLCKIMNLIEFVPQNYLKSFSECLLCELSCMKPFDVISLELVYSNQKRMKLYRFKYSDCDSDDTEHYLARIDAACSSNCGDSKSFYCGTKDNHCTDLTGHSGIYA